MPKSKYPSVVVDDTLTIRELLADMPVLETTGTVRLDLTVEGLAHSCEIYRTTGALTPLSRGQA